mmetsp:Transcript_39592/g.117582  ORF Transcript_39592/g.117582 Transcript_39592/m.117582 type:complete len:388 (+) Transcript_39592:547-1710(+)
MRAGAGAFPQARCGVGALRHMQALARARPGRRRRWCCRLRRASHPLARRQAQAAGLLVPGADLQALGGPCRGGGGSRDLPPHPQPPQRFRRVRAKERCDVHPRGVQAHPGAGPARGQCWRRRRVGRLRHRRAGQRCTAWHHGLGLHLCLLRDPCARCGGVKGHTSAHQRGRRRARRPYQGCLRVVARPDRPPLARPREGARRRQRVAKAAGCLPPRGVVRGPQDQVQARAQVGHSKVRPLTCPRASAARRARNHPRLRRQSVRKGSAARRRGASLLRHVGRSAARARAPARARRQDGRFCPLHQRVLPQGDHRLLLAQLLEAAARHARRRGGDAVVGRALGSVARPAWGPGGSNLCLRLAAHSKPPWPDTRIADEQQRSRGHNSELC